MSISTISFLAQLDKTLELSAYRILSFDLNVFKSKINRHLLTVGSCLIDFLYALIFLSFFFL